MILVTARLTRDTGFAPAFDIPAAVADYVAWRAGNPRLRSTHAGQRARRPRSFLDYSGNESTGFYFCHGANVDNFISIPVDT
jgi:hypothetical protein